MQIFLKENYVSADSTKVLHVSLLKVIRGNPEFLRPPYSKTFFPENAIYGENYGGQPTQLFYHTDYLSACYKYSDDYGHEINADLEKAASEDEGVLFQTVWDIVISDCSFEIGASAEKLANSVCWELYLNLGQDLLTRVLSAKFSSSFFTKCAILSDVVANHSSDQLLAEFVEYNDIGLPLAHRTHIAESMGDLDEEDLDNLDYIDETWEQLCETLGVDKDGDYTSIADMRKTI